MQMKKRDRGRSLSSGLLLGALAAAFAGQPATAAPPFAAQPGAAPNRPAPPNGASAATDEGDGPVTPERPVAPGEWSENKRYKFRLERIEACGTGSPRTLRGDVTWIGAFFTVEAKEPELFVTVRDLELRRGGVILNAAFAEPPDLPGCKPLLVPKRLRVGETLSGFALFEVPRNFRVATRDPIVISYRPTRWGGARRADVPVPECLDACSKPWVTKSAKAGGRVAPVSRQKVQ
jgi:hypothetical protein